MENAALYAATIGGLGLTGLITWAELQLRPIVSRGIDYEGIKFNGIEEFLEISVSAGESEYTVAWIDCVSQGANFARGIFMRGTHSQVPGPLNTSPEPRLSVPFDFPSAALNRYSVAAFNTFYFLKQFGKRKSAVVDYEPFFYPLDSVLRWNRIYGREGLVQFQCVLPDSGDPRGIIQILRAITASGLASFLAVIKVFGDKPSPGMLSFPRPGITLALDFPIRKQITFELLHRLAETTMEHGGSMYPAKDARMTPLQFQTFYPQWREFARFIDPAFDSAFWQRVTAHV
jgi:FAD/FMN-containing dehydrogenase